MRNYINIIILALCLASCSKDENKNILPSGLYISMNTACGWCAGGDSLFITQTRTYLESQIPCDATASKLENTTNKDTWDEVLSVFDWETFASVNINTCYVCVDGCDSWITVTEGSKTHTIRFDYTQDAETIRPVKDFIDKLLEIKGNISTEK